MSSKYVIMIVCLVLSVKYVCNEKKNAKIMNGLIASPRQFPFMVSLQIQHTGQHFCGGAIINSNHVLTAAHCMYASISEGILFPASKLKVRAGTVNLTKDGKTAQISKIFIHEHYESRILDNDIAILRLAGKGFQFSSDIQPVKLSSGFVNNATLNNNPCTILGWGRQCGSIVKKQNLQKADPNIDKYIESNEYMSTEYFTNTLKEDKKIDTSNWKSSNTTHNLTSDSLVETFVTSSAEMDCVENHDDMLRYAEIPIQNSTECAKDYKDANITDVLICAGTRRSRIDTCKGDSGGPLICNGKIEGIVSFGDGCDNWNHLGVYTRVYNHLDWINKTIHSSACNLKNIIAKYLLLINVCLCLLLNR